MESCLYDLQADPSELNNRIADPALCEVRRELRAKLLAAIEKVEHQSPRILPLAD